VNHTTGSSGRSSTGLVKCMIYDTAMEGVTKREHIQKVAESYLTIAVVRYVRLLQLLGLPHRDEATNCTYRLTQMTVMICVVEIRRFTTLYMLVIMAESCEEYTRK
jgi:hypothetical protein